MADVKIQDVNLIATPEDTNKLPVSDGSGVAKTISVAQINGVHEAAYDHSTYLTETSADALYAPVLGADDNYITDAEKTKLSGIADGAEVNVNADWNATSGDAQILNKPIIPSVSGLLDETTHDLLDHTGLTGIPSTAGLLDETAHDLLDHTGLTGIPVAYNLPTASNTVLGGVKIDGTTILISDGVISSTGGSGGGVTDHGLLTGLSDDDHSQYHTDARGDARYQPIGTYSTDIHSNITALNAVSGTNTGDQDLSGYSLTTHNHSLNNLTEKSYNSLTDKPSIPSITGLLDETAHDLLDHTGLTGIPAAYSLPTASTTVLGGVKVDGTTVTIADGVISSSGGPGMTNPMTAAGDIIIGGTSGAPTRLAKGDDGQVLTLASGLPSWAAASGGSAAIDWTSPVVVTDTANLAYGKHYIVAVTAADKTLTLPEITAADYGKMIVVEIAAATTKLITVDGYSTQAIDGTATRVMWAKEVAQLVATANGWTKVGGKSIPMAVGQYLTGGQLFSAGAATKILIATNYSAVTSCASMLDLANKQVVIKRLGCYQSTVSIHGSDLNSSATQLQARLYKNAALFYLTLLNIDALKSAIAAITTPTFSFVVGDVLSLYGYYSVGAYDTTVVYNDGAPRAFLTVQEVLTW